MRKNWFVVERDHQVLLPSINCDIPLVRGDFGSGICIPLSVEVIVIVWLSTLSLKCEVDSCLA